MGGDERDADERARGEADEQRRADEPAEEQSHDGRQLHVAHAHAGGIGDRRGQQQAARGRAGDEVLRQARRVGDRPQHEREHRARGHQPVRDDPLLEVGGGGRDQDHGQRKRGPQRRFAPELEAQQHEQACRDRFDQRVAQRDAHLAVAAASAQQQPRDDRDVVPRADGGVAPGAARARLDDRLAAREAVGEDVHEASERRTAHAEQDQLARGGLHGYQMPPALQPPVFCGEQVRSIVPVGSRWTLKVTGADEVDVVCDLELVAGRRVRP